MVITDADFERFFRNSDTGGTILGTSRQPFKLMRVPDEMDLIR